MKSKLPYPIFEFYSGVQMQVCYFFLIYEESSGFFTIWFFKFRYIFYEFMCGGCKAITTYYDKKSAILKSEYRNTLEFLYLLKTRITKG